MSSEASPPQNETREFENIRIPMPWGHVAGRWYGSQTTRPILALHGWLDNSGTFDTLIPLMPKHISVLAIDLPGHGDSSRLPPGIIYHAHGYLSVVRRIVHHYSWNKVSFMAHSMASAVAFVFAACYPERVDMLIQFDSFHPMLHLTETTVLYMQMYIENFLIEEQRIREKDIREPPSYPYDEVVRRIHDGSIQSVDKDKCHHLMGANVAKSTLYPSKYYFSRDPRLKSYVGFSETVESMTVMAKRIKNIPQLVIKATDSMAIDEEDPLLDFSRKNNPYFEFHILDGTHHVHLNNAQETSVIVNRFINKWKPQVDSDDSLQVDEEDEVKPQPQICPAKPHQISSDLASALATASASRKVHKAKL